jgi:hypothetical protein
MQKSTPRFLLLATYLDFFFYGPLADSRPSEITASVPSRSPSKSPFPSSPIYRSFDWFDLDYGAMERAWEYATRQSPWVEPILRARYTPPYATFVELADEWECTVRTVSYWHHQGAIAFLSSYAQQTRKKAPNQGVNLEMDEWLDNHRT